MHYPPPFKTNRLIFIDLMRCFLVFILIMYHAFAPYCGNWTPIDGHSTNGLYFWIGKILHFFFLEIFVFISGYIIGHQIKNNATKSSFNNLVTKKVKRLMIPSLIFSTLYLIMFKSWSGNLSNIYDIVNGVGHMWFLPMLFWCFFLIWIVEARRLNYKYVVVVALILSLAPLPLPFRIGNATSFFLYFLLGFIISKQSIKIMVKKYQYITGIILFIIFCSTSIYLSQYSGSITLVVSRILHTSGNLLLLPILLQTFKYIESHYHIPHFIYKIAAASFGIYILQQFVLIYVYYHTNIPKMIDWTLLPWIATFSVFIITFATTHFAIKTKPGQFLLQ